MNDTITGAVLDYAENVECEAMTESGLGSYFKAFWAGVVKGFVDSTFVAGIVFWGIALYTKYFKKGD